MPEKRGTAGRFNPAVVIVIVISLFPSADYAAAGPTSRPSRTPAQQPQKSIREPLAILKGHNDSIHHLTFSPDGSRLASASFDKTVRLWDVSTQKELRLFEGHRDRVNCVAFSPDGSRIVSGSADNTVRVWDAKTGEQLSQFDGHRMEIVGAFFLPDGRHVLSGSHGDSLVVWNVEQEKVVRAFPRGARYYMHTLMLAPNGKLAVTGGCGDQGILYLYDVEAGQLLSNIPVDDFQIAGIALTPDSSQVVACAEARVVKVFDVKSGRLIRKLQATNETAQAVAVTPDGKWAAGTYGHSIDLFEIATGRKVLSFDLPGEADWVQSLAFSPDGHYLASGEGGVHAQWGYSAGRSNGIRLWDLPQALQAAGEETKP